MKERKISYAPAMVKAKLEKRKTITRRVVVPQPWDMAMMNGTPHACWRENDMPCYEPIRCPFGVPGDVTWIQENYRIESSGSDSGRDVLGHYLADGQSFFVRLSCAEWKKFKARKYPFRNTPGRFMYKSLSRMKDEIVSVGVQRVQDISEEDARDEGFPFGLDKDDISACLLAMSLKPEKWKGIHRTAFARYWQLLNGKREGCSWDMNPFVWRIETREVV